MRDDGSVGGFAPQRSELAAALRQQLTAETPREVGRATRRAGRRWAARLLLLSCLPLGGCALLSASTVLWGALVVLLGSAVALASSGGEQPVRVAPAATQPRAAQPLSVPSFEACSGWVHKSCGANNKIVGSCCPKNAKCNYRYSPYADCGKGTCLSGTTDRAMCPHPKKGPKTKKACLKKHGFWKQTCRGGKLGMECLPGMPTNYNGTLADIYPQARFVRCKKAPDPACRLGTSKAKCKKPARKPKRR